MSKVLIEVCCGSADDVIQAKLGGADRVELSSCMFMGGLTPSVGTVTIASRTGLPVMAMNRPRDGGFCYTDTEFEVMLLDAAELIKAGAAGIVFGFLNQDGTVNVSRCKEMMKVIGSKQSMFHRAFDVVPDWKAAMDELIGLKVTRILTSGQHKNSQLGAETLKQMIEYADGRIEILICGGIRENNVRERIAQIGADQVHAYLAKEMTDSSLDGNPEIDFVPSTFPPKDKFKMIDVESVKRFIKEARSGE